MSTLNNVTVHCLSFLILAFAMAMVVATYREEEMPKIWRGALKRFLKIVAFTAVLAALLLLVEWSLFRVLV